jgi:hemoglobin
MRATTVFEDLGGFARVRLIVSDFYDKVLASERLSRFFQDIDIPRLIDHQTKFISAVMGGPASFSDEHIARAHGRLGISGEDFDEMAALFRETLEDFDLPTQQIERLDAHMTALREHVVAGGADAPGVPAHAGGAGAPGVPAHAGGAGAATHAGTPADAGAAAGRPGGP